MMTIYNLSNKEEVSVIAKDTLALLDYQSANELGYDTNLSPISHHTHDLKLHFLESVGESITPLTMYYYESSIVLICANPELYKEDVYQMLTSTSNILD